MALVFGAIAPHGGLAVAEACEPGDLNLAVATREAMEELGRRFAAARPEAVVVLSPHSIHVEGAMAVVIAAILEGRLAGSPEAVELRVPVERGLALGTVAAIRSAGIPVAGVSFGSNDPALAEMPLDWGALIPLWYMGGRTDPPVPAVVVAPARDLSAEVHIKAGAALAGAVVDSGLRVAIIASADHGHRHDAAGPFGYDPASAEYDAAVRGMVEAGDLSGLAAIDPGLVDRAYADSWWQMLMLHGALGEGWGCELLSYEVPTYFGMLCAAFEPATDRS